GVSIYATDANGHTQKTYQLIVQFNSYVKLTCETDVEGTSLIWEHSATRTTPFVPVVSSPFVSVTEESNRKLLLELTKSRMSSSGVYRCRGPSGMRSVSVHVVGAINSVNGSVILRQKEEILGRLFFFSSHIDPDERPSISCQFVIGNPDPDQTKIIWRGGLCKSHPEFYETSNTLNLSSSTASGRLTLIHPGLNSQLYGTYQCILKVGSDEAVSSEVKLANIWSIALPTVLVIAELLLLSGCALFYAKSKNMYHRQVRRQNAR
ncbi:hypothetical protein AHF37_06239, partial [Paragonimus kellicotti]